MSTVYQTIVAKAFGQDRTLLAISASDNDNWVHVQKVDYESELQYWELRPARGESGFALVNKKRGLCIAREGGGNGSRLCLVGLEQIATNDKAVWRFEGGGATYGPINSYADWEQKINIPGDGPYTPGQILITWEWSRGVANELWVRIPDTSKVTMKSIVFDMDRGNIQDQEPLVAFSQTLVNDTSTEEEQTLNVAFVESHTYGFNREKGIEVTGSVEFEAGLPVVGKSKVKTQVKGTWKLSTSEESSDEQQVSLVVPVKVPPRTAIRVNVLMLRARLDVKYTATLLYTYPDGSTVERTSIGLFTGVNGYEVTTKFEELGQVMNNVELTPFDPRRGAHREAQYPRVDALGASDGAS